MHHTSSRHHRASLRLCSFSEACMKAASLQLRVSLPETSLWRERVRAPQPQLDLDGLLCDTRCVAASGNLCGEPHSSSSQHLSSINYGSLGSITYSSLGSTCARCLHEMKRCRQRPWCLGFCGVVGARKTTVWGAALQRVPAASWPPESILFVKNTHLKLSHTPQTRSSPCRRITATFRRWRPPPTSPVQSAAPAASRSRQGPWSAAQCCCAPAPSRASPPSPCAPPAAPPGSPCSWRRY